ncbi:MAG TPA: hypothetical protein VGO47_00775, partial [Chlamydiales bacterium]|nr:hypothetical protein [Chlamydiales bacterium]
LDPDDPVSGPPSIVKRQKQPSESREVQVVAKKTSEDKTGGQSFQGGISQTRRDMLIMLRDEAEEPWQELTFCDGEVCFTLCSKAYRYFEHGISIWIPCTISRIFFLKNLQI